MTGGCHCGAVQVILQAKPNYVNDCNCSLCSNAGALWGYFAPSDVSILGETQCYARTDRDNPGVTIHFCKTCGATTHWAPLPHIPQTLMGANMRLFDYELLNGIELRFPNGKNWDGSLPYGFRKPPVTLRTVAPSWDDYFDQPGVPDFPDCDESITDEGIS